MSADLELTVRGEVADVINRRIGRMSDHNARRHATHALRQIGKEIYEALAAAGVLCEPPDRLGVVPAPGSEAPHYPTLHARGGGEDDPSPPGGS